MIDLVGIAQSVFEDDGINLRTDVVVHAEKHCVLIDRISDRLTNLHIVKGSLRSVELDKLIAQRIALNNLDVIVGVGQYIVRGLDIAVGVDIGALKVQQSCTRVCNRNPLDMLDGRCTKEVILIRLKNHLFTSHPVDKLVGAGSHRLSGKLLIANSLNIRLAHDGAKRQRQTGEDLVIGSVQNDLHMAVIHLLHALYMGETGGRLWGVDAAVNAEHNIVNRQ